ncbi:hypothetical protein G6F37_008848 [Rhizopus arrhizus]|nr:hypothetical protein G6F38_008873 [Rhizopus arrhizus]KAG1155102.1 hypothetical protein G6F37_008848 [Rhizopus arrhizus]
MSAYNRHDDDFYEKPRSPPVISHHVDTSRDSNDQYNMKEIPVNSPSPYPVYNQHNVTTDPGLMNNQYSDPHQHGYGRDSLSDVKFIGHYDSDDDMEKIIPRERKKRSCMDKMCCGCCTCCPKWMRWCTCIIFIIIIILAIVIGVLAALFKVPTVTFSGLEQSPAITHNNNVLNMTFNLGITVNNPNFESITFEKIVADAYYPSPYNVKIGGGEIDNVHINSNGITNITFPFSVAVNSTNQAEQGVLMDLVTKCGLDGSAKENINFNYYVYPTVRIIGIPITPTISKSMSIACPLQGDDLTSILGSG